MKFRLPQNSSMAPQFSIRRPHPVLRHIAGPKVYYATGLLFDEIDIAWLPPRRDHVEPAYHNRKQHLKPKVEEPDWNNVEEAKAWLEQRFTGSAAKGSPLLQYMIASRCWSRRLDMPREKLSSRWLLWSLSEGETGKFHDACPGVGFVEKPKDKLPLYPEYGEGPKPLDKYDFLPYDRVGSIVDSEMSEDEDMTEDQDTTLLSDINWDNPSCPVDTSAAAKMMENRGFVKDREAVKAWLERRYRVNDVAIGSPMFQFMKEFYAGPNPLKTGSEYMCNYLPFKELFRWSNEGNCTFIYWRDAEPLYPGSDLGADNASTGLPVAREKVPVMRNKRGRKPGASPKQPKPSGNQKQNEKEKEKPKGQPKSQQAYVNRLRARVSKRSHEKSELVCLEFKGRKAELAKLR